MYGSAEDEETNVHGININMFEDNDEDDDDE